MWGVTLCVAMSAAVVAGRQPGELIERTVAIVGGQVITLSDIRTAAALQLIDVQLDAGSQDLAALEPAVLKLVDRLLMLREVQRYVPAEPDPAAIARSVDIVRRRFTTPEALAATLAAGGFTEARLLAWVRDDLRIAAYLDQRFASVGVPTDGEVADYYAAHRAEFDQRGVSLADAAPVIRDRVFGERRTRLIADWVDDLRRRTPIVELWKTPHE